MAGGSEGERRGGETMSKPEFSLDEAKRLLGDVFAPWVQDLRLAVEGLDPHGAEPGAALRMPFSQRLCREGGIVCGQALMALADTAMVFAIATASGSYRPMTTVDQTTHFMRPVANADVIANARILRLGKTMAFGRVMLTGASDQKAVAMISSAYALL